MSVKLKVALLSCLVLASLGVATSAGAATATITNGGAVSGTATSGVLFTFSSRSVGCTTAAFTATLVGATGTLPLSISTNVQPLFPAPGGASCVILGGLNATVACTALGRLDVTGVTTSGITPVRLSNIACTISVTASPTCSVNVTGAVRGQFDNATSKLTILTAGQTLAASGSTCTILPNAASLILSNTSGGNVDYVVRQVGSGAAVRIVVV